MPTAPPPRRPLDDDHDDTGVQRLLSSLPDPEPMPPALVDRIQSSLREESLRRAAGEPEAAPVALLGRRRPRRTWLLAGAAAAAVVIGGTVASQQLRGGAGTSAHNIASPGSVAGSTPRAAAPSDRSVARGAVTRGHQHIQLTTTAYTTSQLRAQAAAMRATPADPILPPAAEAPSIGPIATPVGLASCLTALDLPGDALAFVDLATYDGRPAAVIVTHTDDHDQVHVVERSCSTGNPGLIAGPYQL